MVQIVLLFVKQPRIYYSYLFTELLNKNKGEERYAAKSNVEKRKKDERS